MFIRVLDEFKGDLLKFESGPGTEFEFIEESILAITSLDTFIAKLVAFPRSDGTDKGGVHPKKLCHDSFA